MSQTRISPLGMVTAIGWLAVPVLWGAATVIDRSRRWEDGPLALWLIGSLALVGAAVVTLLMLIRAMSGVQRRGLVRAGHVFYALGLVATVVAAWAVQLWMAFFGVGLLLFGMASRRVRWPAMAIGAGMLAGLATQIVLTLAQVGTPDRYGDYPVAWTTATIIATGAAATGSLFLRGGREAIETAPAGAVA